MEVFHQFRENLKGLAGDSVRETSEYCSEVSEDYNSVDGSSQARRGILKAGRSLPPEDFQLPPKLVEQLRAEGGKYREGKGDSGFTSEQNSSYVSEPHSSVGTACDVPSNVFNSELGSNYLAHYGLDGPLPEYQPPPSDYQEPPDEPSEIPLPSGTSIGTRKKRATEKKNATIRQHYYPEGGWGWVVLCCALAANLLAHGLQLSYGVTLLAVTRRWGDKTARATEWLGSLSICTSLLLSPLTIATCRRKSTRLTAVVGGLITALGLLFTSFASQFHQMFFSYGIIMGIGVGFVRDTSTLMVAQYFKRKREAVEVVVVSGSGLGITCMSHFLQAAIGDVGWRIGLQCVTGVLFTTFILGMFYRSATLYHPQRRAILHLKSQKRKIKDKNKTQEHELPFFDFSSLKSRTFQIILVSSFVSSFGMFTPILLLLKQTETEKVVMSGSIQTYLGLAWICGVFMYGLVLVRNSMECRIGRQYLCQTAGLSCGISLLVFTSVGPGQEGTATGYTVFVWIFGIFAGGYQYALKMYVFEKVRARNFGRAWGFLQMSQSLPACLGVPLSGYLESSYGPRTGYYFSGLAVLLGSAIMFLINIHKMQLRARKLSRRRKRAAGSVKSTSTSGRSEESYASPQHEGEERRNSFAEEEDDEDLLPELALINSQQALLELIERHTQDGLPVMPGMENMPEHLLLEELEMLDNITSCNVVDNYLMLDEYEQNLIKEGEGAVPGGGGMRSRLRKWSLVRQPGAGAEPGGRRQAAVLSHPPGLILPVGPLSGLLARRAITTIGEEKEEKES